MKYKATWKTNSLNKKFWEEVLAGRKIKRLTWGKDGMKVIVFDNGEKVYTTGVFFIKNFQGRK